MPETATNPYTSQGPAPSQALLDSYDAVVTQDIEQQNQQLMQSISAAAGGDANAAAAAQKLGYQVGVGPDIARANMTEYRRRAAVIDAQKRQLQDQYPGTASYLMNPHFSAIAHDDLDNLTGTEKLFAMLKQQSPLRVQALGGMVPQISLSPDVTAQYEAGKLQHEVGLLGFKAGTGDATADDWTRINQIQARLKEISPQQSVFGGVAQMGGLMKDQGIGALTAGVFGGAVTGGATAWLSGGLAAEAVPEATMLGARFASSIWMAQDIYRMTAGQTYLDLHAKGVDDLKAQLAAAGVGVVNTALMMGFTKLAAAPVAKAFNAVLGEKMAEAMVRPTVARATARIAGNLALGSVEGGATMAGQELVTRIGEDLATSWQKGKLETAMSTPEGRSELADSLVKSFVNGMAVVGLTNLPGSMLQYHLQMGQVGEASRTAQFFEDLTKAAAESKVRERNPNAFESFIGAQARRAGADTIYVNGEQMQGILNQSGLKPEEIEKVIPGLVQETATAAAAGDDVKIPTAQYASKLAGTALGDQMKPHMRLDPEGTSPAEMVAFLQEQKAQHDAARALAEQKMATDEAFAESAKVVGKDIFEKIKATGAYPDPVARTNAQLLRDMIVTMAANSNQMPEEFYAEHGPAIEKMTASGGVFSQTLPSRWPTAAKLTPSVHEPMIADLDTLRQDPVQYQQAVDAVAAEPGMKTDAEGADAKTEAMIARMQRNLEWLHDQVPEEIRTRSKMWYDGAHKIANDWALKYGKTRAQMAGMLAVLSPQKDWFMNVTMGERLIDILSTKMDHAFDEKMKAAAFRFLVKDFGEKEGKKLNTKAYDAIGGKTLREVAATGDLRQMGVWLRAYDEAYHTAQHAVIHPEGDFGEPVKGEGGEDVKRAWGGFDAIGKAASIYLDGSPENISRQLGGKHKVRNFYNNIFNPADPRFTTIDTHAVAAALMRPLAGNDKAVADNFGSTGGTKTTGVSGSYPIYYEAYKRAAEAKGILPREMQSITWEAVRGLFTEEFKQNKKNKAAIDAIWERVDKGEITEEEARQEILARAGGIEHPDWWKGGRPPTEEEIKAQATRDKTYSGERAPFAGSKLTFEVAPDPTNTRLTARWNALPAEVRLRISHDIAWRAAGRTLAHFEDEGTKGELHMQMGGYKDNTNPSMSLWADPTVSMTRLVQIARVLGHVLDQEQMMVTSPKKFKGGEQSGTIVIDDVSNQDAEAIYNGLRANVVSDTGKPLINGHTTGGGQMVILVPESQKVDLAKRVAAHLGDAHEVGDGSIYGAWPEKGKDSYGLRGKKRDKSESSLRAFADQLRSETSRELEQRIREAEGGILEQAATAGGPRAGFDPQRLAILLGPNSDFSSFAHEAGHYYLTVLGELAKRSTADAPTPFGKDMAILLKWFGVKDLDAWHSMSLEEQRKYHEQFAYSFEQYLAEGKAPSVELEGVFERFKMWMKRIYVSAASEIANIYRRETGEYLPVPTGEVRQVMDRMLATDEQIRQAEAVRNMEPVFKEKPEGMSDAEWERYRSLNAEATESGATELGAAAMRDMQWQSNARSRVLKAMQAQHEALRAQIREEVAPKVEQSQPVYGAEKFLRTGELTEDGEVVGHHAEHKLDTEAVKEILSQSLEPGQEPDMDRFRGMTRKDGLHPDDAAERLGFASGEELVRALRDAKPLKEEIDGQTDRAMVERYGEVATPQGMQDATEKAVHNEARAHLIAFELKHALNSTTSERVMVKAAQATARQMLAGKPLSEINPREHAAKEAAAARRAQVAAARGDAELVQTAKRHQLLQNALAREAIAIKQEALQKQKALEKYGRPSPTTAKAIGADYMDRITELLSKWGMTSETRAANKQSLLEWLDAEEDKTGVRPPVSDAIAALTGQAGFARPEDMTITQLRDLHDAVKGLDFTGRARQQIILDGQRQTLDEFAHDVQRNMANVKHTEPVDIRQDLLHAKGLDKINARWLQFRSWIKSRDAALLKMEQFFQWLDTGARSGATEAPISAPFQRLFRRASLAASAEESMRAGSAIAMRALAKGLADSKINLNDKLDVPELPRGRGRTKMYREELIAVALNMGNESNKQKLLEGYGWHEPQVIAAINRLLSKPEMNFVQGVLDHLGTYGPQLEEIHRRQTGLPLKMIEAAPISTDHGTYAGGYYPVEYDSFQDRGIEQKQARQADSLFENSFSHPATNKGSTIERTGYVGPIHLSLGVIPKHIDQVTHDIAWREAITDMNKVLSDERILDEVDQTYGKEYSKQFRPWLQAMANDKVYNTTGDAAWENIIRKVRSNATMVGLGFRLSTIQIHGLSALANSIGEVGPIWFAKGMNQFTGIDRIRESRQFIYDRSPEMANRMDTADKNVHEAVDDIRHYETQFGPGNVAGKTFDGARLLSMRGVGISDMMSALPTWMGAYLKGMAKEADGGLDLSEADAVAYADRAVRNAHGGGGTQDLAAIQRDKGLVSIATMFYSFWNHMYNRQRDLAKGWGALATGQAPVRDFPRLLARSFFYFAVPQIAHALLKPSPKASDGSLEEFAKRTAEEIGLGFVSGVPIVRDIAAAVVNGRDYTISPLEQAGKSIATTIENGMKIIEGEEPKKNALKTAGIAAGYLWGLPLGQPLATARFLWDVIDGDQEPEDLKDWWQGIMTGKIPAR